MLVSLVKKENKTMKKIQLYKMWSEYTDEEKAILPPLNPKRIESGDVNYMWNGQCWEYVPLDW